MDFCAPTGREVNLHNKTLPYEKNDNFVKRVYSVVNEVHNGLGGLARLLYVRVEYSVMPHNKIYSQMRSRGCSEAQMRETFEYAKVVSDLVEAVLEMQKIVAQIEEANAPAAIAKLQTLAQRKLPTKKK